MSTQVRPPRAPRSGGGRTLMLLGVLLALAAGTIVIYVVSAAGGSASHTVVVVVAAKDLPASTILSSATTDATHTLISDAFTTKPVNSEFAPANVYVYQNPDRLNADLNDKVIVGQFYAGDILRVDDPRLVKLGEAAVGSLTNRNPAELPKGSVIFPLQADRLDGFVPGDHIDILVTACIVTLSNTGGSSSTACNGVTDLTQTTLQNLYVYAVGKDVLDVVLTHQQALELKFLVEHSKVTVVLRKSGDSDPDNTTAVNGQYIINHFNFGHP